MAEEKAEIVIGPAGSVDMRVEGVAGTRCVEDTDALVQLLGGPVEHHELTEETYQQAEAEEQDPPVAGVTGLDLPWRLHAVLPRSAANGPGTRCVWSQGCSLGCPGCFNPETHAGDGEVVRPVGEIAGEVLGDAEALDGVTLTGGEPLEQPEAVAADLVVAGRYMASATWRYGAR